MCKSTISIAIYDPKRYSSQEKENASAGNSPSDKISPPKNKTQNSKMSDNDLSAMEKHISDNVTTGIKQDYI